MDAALDGFINGKRQRASLQCHTYAGMNEVKYSLITLK